MLGCLVLSVGVTFAVLVVGFIALAAWYDISSGYGGEAPEEEELCTSEDRLKAIKAALPRDLKAPRILLEDSLDRIRSIINEV